MKKAELLDLFPGHPIAEEPHPLCSCCGASGLATITGPDGGTFSAPCWCVIFTRDQLGMLAGYLGILPRDAGVNPPPQPERGRGRVLNA